MEIKLTPKNTPNLLILKEQIYWTKIDFKSVKELVGNKELLEKTFQEIKKEELNG